MGSGLLAAGMAWMGQHQPGCDTGLSHSGLALQRKIKRRGGIGQEFLITDKKVQMHTDFFSRWQRDRTASFGTG
jgi:hypothetical protein